MSKDLNDPAAWPFPAGANEMTIKVRVSRYEDDHPTGDPAAFQCWIENRDGRVPRAVGIRSNPVSAIKAAIDEFHRLSAGETPSGAKKKKQRTEEDLLA